MGRNYLVDIVVTDPGRPGTYWLPPEAPECEILGVTDFTSEPQQLDFNSLPEEIAEKIEEKAYAMAVDAFIDAEAEKYLDNEVTDD